MNRKVPVTILTGFLGSGKTTLVNRILSEAHGKRIAIIENEYGEIGIDQALVIQADEEIFEMSNGCICCTVRGDLIRILGRLSKRREKFDYVLVETTGLADPGPVAQTFFMDDEVKEHFALDGIVTVVDAKHVEQQLGRSKESEEQIAFADVILLNKTDLVDASSLDRLEGRVRSMNRMARIHRTQNAAVDVGAILGLSAFDLDQALEKRPTFLEPEYPFEWSGVYALSPGKYTLSLAEGPDPEMSIAISTVRDASEAALRETAERCVRVYAEPPVDVNAGVVLDTSEAHRRLRLEGVGRKDFTIEVENEGLYVLTTQHLPEEFQLEVLEADGVELVPVESRAGTTGPDPRLRPTPRWSAPPRIRGALVEPIASRTWVAAHEHDDEVSSVAIEALGDVNPDKLSAWISRVLRENGLDIFRMKGFIGFPGEPRRYVLQGVHMLMDVQPGQPWGDAPRKNQIVFIGRNLDRDALSQGFLSCVQ